MSATNSTLTQERLKELLKYNPDTGVFVRIKHSSRFATRSRLLVPIGAIDSKGHVQIRVDGRLYLAHRLAWLYVYGFIPNGDIDHINGNRSDNALSNIRIGTHAQNMQNRRTPSHGSKTGFLGVSPTGRRYQARIGNGPYELYLGSFDTAEEAHAAYLKAKRELHEFCTI